MSNLLIGFLGAMLATNQPVALNTLLSNATGISIPIDDPNDPVAAELRKIMEDDDAAHDEADKLIQGNQEFADKGGGVPREELASRIRGRLATVKKAYGEFLEKHPNHAKAHLAFGSFLNDNGEEEAAQVEWEKSRNLAPHNPAAWNNLANSYGHIGPIKKAFQYYAKAIELNPNEAIYYQNLGTSVYLFRKDSKEYYNLTEQQVFDKALHLYEEARKLDPNNFELATDVAETYYGIRPTRTEDALIAWTNALQIATSDIEREGVNIHLARFKLHANRFAEAHEHLNSVTNAFYNDLKKRVLRHLNEQEAAAKNPSPPGSTNAPIAPAPEPAFDLPESRPKPR